MEKKTPLSLIYLYLFPFLCRVFYMVRMGIDRAFLSQLRLNRDSIFHICSFSTISLRFDLFCLSIWLCLYIFLAIAEILRPPSRVS